MTTTPAITPSTKLSIPIVALATAVMAVAGAIGEYCVSQYKINNHETRIDKIETELNADHEMLTRIDERVGSIKTYIEKQKN